MKKNKFIVFGIEDRLMAFDLYAIEKIVHAVEIIRLPQLPENISGIIYYHEQVTPVINIRKLLMLPPKEIDLNDQIILIKMKTRTVAAVVDNVTEVVTVPENDFRQAESFLPEVNYIEGSFKYNNEIVFVYNLDKFFSSEEEVKVENYIDNL